MFTPIGFFASGLDPDAKAFLTATSITDPTITTAINDLVVDLKSLGIWNYFYAIYPFVGGTATTHKFNLKNPLDTDAAYRLSFAGGWTHNSNGITGNGSNTSANTFLTPSTGFTTNDAHMSIYSRTNVAEDKYDMGAFSPSPNRDTMIASRGFNIGGSPQFYSGFGGSDYATTGNGDSRGHFIANRDPLQTTITRGFKNGSSAATVVQSHLKPTIPITIGASNRSGGIAEISTRNYAFSSIGEGFTNAEASSFYTAVQDFQTTLGRQV
jgi:hypothetical protein